jgi:hypothetical protein
VNHGESEDTAYRLLDAAAAEFSCPRDELAPKLEKPIGFSGCKLLPGDILECWPTLSLEARAVAVLCAGFLDDRNESLWE